MTPQLCDQLLQIRDFVPWASRRWCADLLGSLHSKRLQSLFAIPQFLLQRGSIVLSFPQRFVGFGQPVLGSLNKLGTSIESHATGAEVASCKVLPPECVAKLVGAATNILVRDLDLGTPDARDARRLEVVVDGLPLFGGAQLAVDTTLVSAIQGNGEPRNGAAERDGVALAQA